MECSGASPFRSSSVRREQLSPSSTRAAWPGLFRQTGPLLALLFLATRLAAAVQVEIGQNFTATTFGADSPFTPPDTTGAAGPDHFAELLNGRYAVFGKKDGALVQSKSALDFWKDAGVSIASTLDVTDPRIVFDLYSGRWFASMVDVNISARRQRGNRFLIGVSETADPSGTWHGAAFIADPVHGYFADFPTLGVDADAVYLSGDYFDRSGNPAGPTLVAIWKEDLLKNPPDVSGRTWFNTLTYAQRGDILQPAAVTGNASTRGSVLAVGNLGIDFNSHSKLMFSSVQPSPTPGAATLSPQVALTVPAYKIPINPPQPDGSDTLDNGDSRLSASVRRVGDLLYAIHSAQVNGRSALRWYRIDAVKNTLIEAGTITHPSLHLFYPSIAANDYGVVVVGCNGASADTFISSYAAVGETTSGTLKFGELILLKEGLDSYQVPDSTGTSRWGDYSATTTDPSDPNRFWTIQAFPADAITWATQVTELITTPLQLSVTKAEAGIRLSWPASAVNARLEQSSSLNAGSWSAVSDTPVLDQGKFTLTITAGELPAFYRLADTPAPAR